MESVTDAEWAALRREAETFRVRPPPGAGGPPAAPTGPDTGATAAPERLSGADPAATRPAIAGRDVSAEGAR
jgi:hypothetical protein